ncbi:MAG: phosphatase PAP2 family protein [Planctomycetaceae bacterium]
MSTAVISSRSAAPAATPMRISVLRSHDSLVKVWLILVTAAAGFALLIRHGMQLDFLSCGAAVGTVALLLPFAVAFDNRGIPQFANLLTGFLFMVVFNLFLTILTYAGTPLNAALVDGQLIQFDAAMGIHLPSIVEFSRRHPNLQWWLSMSYASVLPSTLLAIVVLGCDRDVKRLQNFVMTFMIAGLITSVVFFVTPAEGPFAAYGYELRADQQRFLDHFRALRSQQFPVVSMSNLEGLITFPSFHTTWAVLLAFGFRHYRWLFVPMLLLNCAVAASTMTTGWHYGSDVAGGLLTAAAAVAAARLLTRDASEKSPQLHSANP